MIHLSNVSPQLDPTQWTASLPEAIVYLLVKVVNSHCTVRELSSNHLVLVTTTSHEPFVDTFDTDDYLEMVCLLQALFMWAGHNRCPILGFTIQPNSYWVPYLIRAEQYNHFQAKFILFITLGLFDFELMVRLAQYDIYSLAEGFKILMAHPELTWCELIPSLRH